MRALLVGLMLPVTVLGCRGVTSAPAPSFTDDAGPTWDGGGGDDAGSEDRRSDGGVPTDAGLPLSAENRYRLWCASCHGTNGEGASGPSLQHLTKAREALVADVTRMPPSTPGLCTGPCAETLVDYLVMTFGGPNPDPPCTEPLVGQRALRLLTSTEYLHSLNALFTVNAPNCGQVTFHFRPPRTLRSAHVAGSFNSWPVTVAAGGWPMTFDTANGEWRLTRPLANGDFQYKFVLDEKDWVTDPNAPATVPDGFGGSNGVLHVACATDAPLTITLPPAGRPDGFPFDNDVDSRTVGTVQVEAYLATAAIAAQRAVSRLDAFVGCDYRGDRATCARTFLTRFGQSAFRRPLTTDELTRYAAPLASGDFAQGVSIVVRAMLSSPHFLYRGELGVARGDGTYRLTPWETASALSFALWQSTPDQVLLDAAANDELQTRAQLEAQARRMLGDPRARATIGTFATQWLGVESILTATKQDPAFTNDTRAAALEQTRRFVANTVFDSTHQYGELLTGKNFEVTSALAPFYGLTATSSTFTPATLPAGRAGVLGLVSVLAATAHADQTSPVRRGVMVRRALLCQDFPKPPPLAGGLPPVDPNASTRERFAQHSANPACAGCHTSIDPVGFGFERYDMTGRERATENGKPIESWGELSGLEHLGVDPGVRFDTLEQLGSRMAASTTGPACFTRQLRRLVHGHVEVAADRCALRAHLERFRQANLDVRELLVSLVSSDDFVVRR